MHSVIEITKIVCGRPNNRHMQQASYVGTSCNIKEVHDNVNFGFHTSNESHRGCSVLSLSVADCWAIGDLDQILNMAWDAREKWYCVGLGLGLNVNDLDHIKDKNKCDADECFIEMMKAWLAGHGVSRDQKSLSNALRQPMVNCIKLADTINAAEIQTTKVATQSDSPAKKEITADDQELFPHLRFDSLGLKGYEITQLKVQLHDDAEKMETDFSRFVLNIITSFKKRGFPPQDLATYVVHMGSLFDDDSATDAIMATDSIDRIMIELRKRKYVTIFNYHLLKNVIQDHGTDSEKESFERYFHSFKEYCKRSLFEVPQFLYDRASTNRIKFALKVTDKFKGYCQSMQGSNSVAEDVEGSHYVKISSKTLGLSVNDTIDILIKFARILDRDVGSFCIVDAKQGCTKIVISVLKSVAKSILLKMDTNLDMKDLTLNGIHAVCGPPGKPHILCVTDSSVTLTWTKPDFDIGSINSYIVFYRSANGSVKQWDSVKTNGQEDTIVICDLAQRASSFIFKVCAFGDFGEGVESEESEEIALKLKICPTTENCNMRAKSQHDCHIVMSKNDLSPRIIDASFITQNQRGGMRDTSEKDQIDNTVLIKTSQMTELRESEPTSTCIIGKMDDTLKKSQGDNPAFKQGW